MGMVDPSHPALRGFQLEYRWENVQEEDFGLGVVSMFISALLGFVVIFFMIVCSSEMSNSLDTPIVKSSSDATQRQKQTQHRY